MGPLKLVTKYTGPAMKVEQAGVTLDRTLHLGMSLGRGAGAGGGGRLGVGKVRSPPSSERAQSRGDPWLSIY